MYSILCCNEPLSPGWNLMGFDGLKQDCLDHIAELWEDYQKGIDECKKHCLENGDRWDYIHNRCIAD